ncbi:MAG: hypothetical protein ACXAE3_14210 [Candidatus Kariarchaeaceae archaeon]|jgi:hypothetical protein
MELNLGEGSEKPLISRLTVHDWKGKPRFALSSDGQTLSFVTLDKDVNDLMIQSKQQLTDEKGVEAFGSFLSGATRERPDYRHLMTIYLPQDDKSFEKFHVTLDDQLEHVDLQSTWLLAVECYSVLYGPLQEYLQLDIISLDKYPLLAQFFARKYRFEPYELLMNGTDLDGTPLEVAAINEPIELLMGSMDLYDEIIEGADMYITTVSGAIIASASFLKGDLTEDTLRHLARATIESPGIYSSGGVSTLWFPFSKTKVGRIDRTISTALNTLSYASDKRDISSQVQTNIATKFHDLLDMLAGVEGGYGLHTDVGQLVCTIKFKEAYQSDLDKVMEVTRELSERIKAYGQAILTHVAKMKLFEPIIE